MIVEKELRVLTQRKIKWKERVRERTPIIPQNPHFGKASVLEVVAMYSCLKPKATIWTWVELTLGPTTASSSY
jgi:hypothetical protein